MTKQILLATDIPLPFLVQTFISSRAVAGWKIGGNLMNLNLIAADLEENCEGRFWLGSWQAWFESKNDLLYFMLKYYE